jgi:hypothetical protein
MGRKLQEIYEMPVEARPIDLYGARDERLKGTHYLWLKGEERRSRRDLLLIHELARSGLKVGRAWAIKEAIRKLWSYRSVSWARRSSSAGMPGRSAASFPPSSRWLAR